ncbi:MAG: hypothetical protein ACYSU1_07345 [Planctomycetota bacterium]|jgi:3-methyladenine DNA glycosylase AlkC
MFRGRARRYRKSGVSAETPIDTALPLLETAAFQCGLPGAMQIGQELESDGYFEAGLVAQWHLVHATLWSRLADLPDPHSALIRWSSHPEAKVRFFAPGLWSLWGAERPEAALRGLLPLADDSDFRVLESTQAFGIRPFCRSSGPEILTLLGPWFEHESPRVRRSAMSAVRPRGFWVKNLEWAVENPAYLAPVLEGFRLEAHRFPANSVANCFNDISHRHPLFALGILQRWLEVGEGEQVEHVARKGLRSLLKAGDPQALALFGFGEVDVAMQVSLAQGKVVAPTTNLHFDLELENRGQGCEVELVYEIETTGRNPNRPRRKKYQGGRHLLPEGKLELRIRERIFDRKAAPLIDGDAAARFYLNGVEQGAVAFRIDRSMVST